MSTPDNDLQLADELTDEELEAISGGHETPASAVLRAMIRRAFAGRFLKDFAQKAAEESMKARL